MSNRKRARIESESDLNEKTFREVMTSKVDRLQKSVDIILARLEMDDEREKAKGSKKKEEWAANVRKLQECLDDSNKKQDEMQKQLVQILGKLETSGEKGKPEGVQKTMTNTSNDEMQLAERLFVLKHIFENVSKMKEGKRYYSQEEDHFGVPWSMYIFKKERHLAFFLKCHKDLNTGPWAVEAEYLQILEGNVDDNEKLNEGWQVFGNEDENNRWGAYGNSHFIRLDELNRDYLTDDKLSAKILVQVKTMRGVYKENLRRFDESMEDVSNMVLIVGNRKFYICKQFLAIHSPFFKTLFFGQFHESSQSEIKLSGIAREDFQNYLEVLYGDPSIDDITVEGILLIADMYDTSIVTGKCEAFLMYESKKTSKKKFQLAIWYNMDKLKEKCLTDITTMADFKAMISGTIHYLDHSTTTELLEKSISLQ